VHGAWGLPELGGPGCGLASAVSYWLMLAIVVTLLRVDPSYQRFHIWNRSWRFDGAAVRRILKLGVPIGSSIFIEVTSFVFMALFLARLGATVLGAQQIVANFAALMFMLPLSLGIGTQVLIGQALGAKQPRGARSIAYDGMRIAAVCGSIVCVAIWLGRAQIVSMYTAEPAVAMIVFELFPILVVFHWFDAVQCIATQALRGYQQTLIPMLIYAVSLWGIGLGVGYVFAYATWPVSSWLQPMGAKGFWYAQAAALVVAAAALYWDLSRVSRRTALEPTASRPARVEPGST
jgi:MATE family multidrug resistance protein